jgi:hypothetical protein
MDKFKDLYRATFGRFGYPLTPGSRVPSGTLSILEQRLRVRIPPALRHFCLVAGRERRFNLCHNRLLAPKDWYLDKDKLVFMEENQAVVSWAVSVKGKSADPAVFQAVNDDQATWVREHRKCTVFLTVMLHYQAVSGGFRFIGSAECPDDVHEKLKDGWTFVGEVNQLWAFSRQNQVICVTPGGGLPFQPAMVLLAGGKTKRDFQGIEESLSVRLED